MLKNVYLISTILYSYFLLMTFYSLKFLNFALIYTHIEAWTLILYNNTSSYDITIQLSIHYNINCICKFVFSKDLLQFSRSLAFHVTSIHWV